MISQKDQILAHLKTYGFITPLSALNDYGCFRLASVIHRLKAEGEKILTEDCKNFNGQTYAKYIYKKSQKEFAF